ncbi:GNAT family N-acetyltransferase [Brachybacterium paraconglomeratum]|uniref:GNAT family N-acetyltransferase n=1 Tax=Brachybacterium paraconglomeratum TaxID=173362 RepID=UPI0031E713D0
MQILDATAAHASGITAIYNHAVQHTTAIWNERTVDAHDRLAWIADRHAHGFPVLVADDRARAQGIRVMIAGFDVSNEGSVRLHERLGFERTGVLREVGTKFSVWLDLAFLQLILEPGGAGGPSDAVHGTSSGIRTAPVTLPRA